MRMESKNPALKQPTAPPAAEVEALLALYNGRRYADTESGTRALLKKYPGFGFGWKLLGGTLQIQGKDALPAFRKVAELMPDDAEAHFNLGVVLKGAGRLDDAAASYRKAIALKADYAEAHSNLGNTLNDLGQHKEAVDSYRHALKIRPADADVHNNLGTALKDLGQLDDAIASYRKAVQLKPDFVLAHYNLGNALKELGQADAAVASYRKAVELKPDFAEAHNNLGTALKDQNQFDAALACYRRVLELKPGFAEAHNNLGVVLKDLNRLDDAVASYRKAVELKPDYAEAHNNLGAALQTLGQPDAALQSIRKAVEIDPDFAAAHSNLGNLLKELGQLDAALASCRKAIQLDPDNAGAHNNLGIVHKELGRLADAATSYRKAIEIKPDFAQAHNNLGSVLKDLVQFDEAVASYRKAVQLDPDFAEAYNNLGIVLKELGQLDDAMACYQRALELKPDFVEAQSNLLFTLNYTAHPLAYCLEQAREYGRKAIQKVTARYTSWQCAEPPERLRVGMVSGDLHNHPVGYFLENLLADLDPARVELIAYPTDLLVDALTARIKPYFSVWKPLYGLNDEAAARLIHADGVHVLLDLSGHTGKNRLPVFAWKPAPVQASWLGYFATTGMAEMDYLLADETGVPEARRKDYTETIWYLPDTRLCFSAPEVDVPVAPLPAIKNGHITFGCFQNLTKAGDEVLAAWSKALGALPDARLRWQCKQFGDPEVIKQQALRLQQHGIDPARVTLHGSISRKAYLAAHAEVDLILDTFPYPGGTTTCEALWMGVPTVTLAGGTLLARQGASLLAAAGLNEWIANDEAEYIAKAVDLAHDQSKLATLREGLREQVRTSPLFDAKRFARHFEDALWGMWQSHFQQPKQ
jgi:protein O-GlcNAc transferase